jgi:glycosyltransferase involved in cell wall biosynthesis
LTAAAGPGEIGGRRAVVAAGSPSPRTIRRRRRRRLEVLLLAPRCPWPAFDGGRQRTLALLRALAERHAVTLSTPMDAGELADARAGLGALVSAWLPVPLGADREPEPAPDRGRVRRLFDLGAELVAPGAPRALRFASPDWSAALAAHGWEKFDAVFCRYPRQAFLVPPAHDGRLVVDADDLVHRVVWQRFLASRRERWTWPLVAEAARCRLDERRRLRRAARVLVCSEQDGRRVGGARVTVVRNGTTPPGPGDLREPEPGVMSFVGNFNYPPNREGLAWFCERVLPRVLTAAPGARLDVAGHRSREAGAELAGRPGLRLLGPVDAPWSCFSGSLVSVVPLLRGAGTRIKILDALACGRPVVSTRAGADGLGEFGAEHGLYRAASAGAMARQVAAVLADPAPHLAAAARGGERVRASYTWQATTAGLAAALEEWVGGRRRRP